MTILEVTEDDGRQLQNIANALATSKKIIVVTGAGISTNCGIPDFRSEEGLYTLMHSAYKEATTPSPKTRYKGTPPASRQTTMVPSSSTSLKGKDLFDCSLWKDPHSTSVFYTFIASLRKRIREEVKAITPTHSFIRTLRDSQKLVRCYTQNIDGLEARAGLCTEMQRGKGSRARFTKKSLAIPKTPARKLPGGDQDGGCEVVQLHGDLVVLRCTLCQKTCGWEEGGSEALLLSGKAPKCVSCILQDQDRRDRGKRGTKIGALRPNIVLYGEEHPAADAISSMTTNDLSFAPDILLVLGTSLHVHGLKVLVREFAKAVHARASGKGKVVFVNLTKPPESVWKGVIDYWVSMDCDKWVAKMKRHRPDIWHIQTELEAQTSKPGGSPGKGLGGKQNTPKAIEEKENMRPNTRLGPSGTFDLAVQATIKTPLRTVGASDRRRREFIDTASPKKNQKRQRSPEPHQLPTPPSSNRRPRFSGVDRRDDQEPFRTPSKRRKMEIIIYED